VLEATSTDDLSIFNDFINNCATASNLELVDITLTLQKCSRNALCKRLGIPECILLVTQRVTKYPLLIHPIIKTTKGTAQCYRFHSIQQCFIFLCTLFIMTGVLVTDVKRQKERKAHLLIEWIIWIIQSV